MILGVLPFVTNPVLSITHADHVIYVHQIYEIYEIYEIYFIMKNLFHQKNVNLSFFHFFPFFSKLAKPYLTGAKCAQMCPYLGVYLRAEC